jgi:hypothetical protein
MFKVSKNRARRIALSLGLLIAGVSLVVDGMSAVAQTAAPSATAPKLGTVKAISGTTLTLATDAGPTVTITVPVGAKVQQLAVGSTDLKTATPSEFGSISVGDRILTSVKAGDTADSFTAKIVVVMKSGDIAQKNAADQAEWRKNGTGGIVSGIDTATGTITVAAGVKKIAIMTSGKTEFRRFANDSVKFQDSKVGAPAQIRVGDQIQARGVKSADGSSIQAVEVVSGSFENLSGLVSSVDAASGKITLKDLATKKVFTVGVTANSDVRKMPLAMATSFAARAKAGAAAATGGGLSDASAAGPPAGGGAGGPEGPGGMRRAGGGGDLSQMVARLPTGTLGDLKTGDAVMIVASEPTPGSTAVTAITLLSGVEPILTANPNGGMNLSGWSMGGGAPAE